MTLKLFLPKQETLGEYDLLAKVGAGGAGAVYRGRHRVSGAIVAVKVLPESTANNALLLQRFEQEFRAARLLDHPNIVRALDFHGMCRTPYLVMEFIEGESLGEKLARDGRMPEDEAVHLIVQVCAGLDYAHRCGVVHRDIKPDNVMVTPDGQVKLTDLGLAKQLLTDLQLTHTGRGLGTPHYMAPEQFRNAKSADGRSDIYSVGATLYAMVTGQTPFVTSTPLEAWMLKTRNEFAPPRQLVPGLSERIDRVIRKAMSSDPQQRQASCRELAEELVDAGPPADGQASSADTAHRLWHVVYQDSHGQPYTISGSAAEVRQWLSKGLLKNARDVRAAESKDGPLVPLNCCPLFRDLAQPAAASCPTEQAARAAESPPPTAAPATPIPPTPPVSSNVLRPGERSEFSPPQSPQRSVDWNQLVWMILAAALAFLGAWLWNLL